MSPDVDITGARLVECIDAGIASQKRWEKSTGHYSDSVSNHVTGRFGESASTWRFSRLQFACVQDLWRDLNRERDCDLVVNDIRIEVKTWGATWWPKYGRAVAASQYEFLRAKADVILWAVNHAPMCRTEPEFRALTTVRISFQGYSLVEEDFGDITAIETGEGSMRRVWNRCLDSVGRKVRKLEELDRYVEARGERILQAIGRQAFGITYAPEDGSTYAALARVVEGRLQGRPRLPVSA